MKIPNPLAQILPVFFAFLIPLSPVFTLEGLNFSGISESTVGAVVDRGESWHGGAEQYANLRLTASIGEVGTFFAAFNVLAAATPESGLVTSGEIERLYASFRFDTTDVSLGLMRIPFGYGLGLRPTDIINPQNPLFPDARLRGVLASLVAWYPRDELKLQGFAVQRSRDYFEGQSISINGESLFGLSIDRHDPSFSLQGIALTTISGNNAEEVLLNFGLSMKFDFIVGFAVDMLATTDGKSEFAEGQESSSIAVAIGFDYSFLNGKLFVLAQYYYTSAGVFSADDSLPDSNGSTGSDGLSLMSLQGGGTSFLRRHYGFLTVLYNHSDYARIQFSVLASPVDASLLPTLRHEFEPVQAVSLVSMLAIPLDRTVFGGSNAGEFGPDLVGIHVAASFSVKYRF